MRILLGRYFYASARRFTVYLFCAGILFAANGCEARNVFQPKTKADFEKLNRTIKEAFPGVTMISTAELATLLDASSEARPVLLDVREEKEYAVSHLARARHVPPDTQIDQLPVGIAKDQLIVTYCSVGYRSARFARRLQQRGYTQVRNLEGSIFAWANEGRPVYRGKELATQVHPYDMNWGRYLDADYRADNSGDTIPN